MAMRFQFDERKGTEALAFIAEQWPEVTAFFASKVLFFAEKEHLNSYGRPIVADTFIAMPAGPVPSTIYDFVRGRLGQSGDPDGFVNAIDLSQYPKILAKRKYDFSVLSDSDIAALRSAIEFCKSKTFSHLSQLTHQEKSWLDAPTNGPMDYVNFIDDDNPARDAIIEEASEFAAYGVL